MAHVYLGYGPTHSRLQVSIRHLPFTIYLEWNGPNLLTLTLTLNLTLTLTLTLGEHIPRVE